MRSQYVSASASYCCRAALYSATLRLYSNAPNIDCATRIVARDLSAGSAANPWDGDNSNAASRHLQLLRTEWSRIAPPGDAQRLPNICNRTSIDPYRYGARPSTKADDPRTMTPRRYSNLSELLALLLDLLERLRKPLERILIRRRGAAPRRPLHRQVGALAHGIDHTRLLGDVLDPGAIVLRVHRELDGADLGGGIGAGLERIADDDRHFVFHVFGRTGRDEDVGRIALASNRLDLRRLRLGKREADLAAAGRGGIGAPIAVLAQQGGLSGSGRRRRGGGGFRRLGSGRVRGRRRGGSGGSGGLRRLWRRSGGFRRLLGKRDRCQRGGKNECA